VTDGQAWPDFKRSGRNRFLQISQHPKGLAGIAAYVQVGDVNEPDHPLRIDDKGGVI
jgi:hypothetical protein